MINSIKLVFLWFYLLFRPLLRGFLKLGQKYKNIFVGFLVRMKTLKFAFEINWPLERSFIWAQVVPLFFPILFFHTLAYQNNYDRKCTLTSKNTYLPNWFLTCLRLLFYQRLNCKKTRTKIAKKKVSIPSKLYIPSTINIWKKLPSTDWFLTE
jgi:hypothetical protein